LGYGCSVLPKLDADSVQELVKLRRPFRLESLTTMHSSLLPTLVVDPHADAAEQLADYLRRCGFPADVATSCWHAKSAVRERYYGCLVLVADLSLPADLECLTTLRRDAPRSWVIVVSLRAYPDAQQVVLRCGADSLLIAPFSAVDLIERLSAFQRRSRPG